MLVLPRCSGILRYREKRYARGRACGHCGRDDIGPPPCALQPFLSGRFRRRLRLPAPGKAGTGPAAEQVLPRRSVPLSLGRLRRGAVPRSEPYRRQFGRAVLLLLPRRPLDDLLDDAHLENRRVLPRFAGRFAIVSRVSGLRPGGVPWPGAARRSRGRLSLQAVPRSHPPAGTPGQSGGGAAPL